MKILKILTNLFFCYIINLLNLRNLYITEQEDISVMSKKKSFIKLIVIIIVLIGGLVFISSAKGDQKFIEESMNEIYAEYKEKPELFKLAKAEIIEGFDAHTGDKINFFDTTNQWVVKITIDENTSCQTNVMRDVEKDKIGDIIDVAYKINLRDDYTEENMNATRLKYIEDTSSIKSYNILICVTSLLLIVAVGYLLYSVIKSND